MSETTILRSCKMYIKKIGPQEFYHRFMYIASSSGCSLLTLNLPLKVIVGRFEIVFNVGWECCTFPKIDEKSLKSTNILWHKCKWISLIKLILTHLLKTAYKLENTKNSSVHTLFRTALLICRPFEINSFFEFNQKLVSSVCCKPEWLLAAVVKQVAATSSLATDWPVRSLHTCCNMLTIQWIGKYLRQLLKQL